MTEKTKKGFRTFGIIVLILLVSGVFAYRKYYRKQIIKEQQYEQNKVIFENQKIQQQKEKELILIEEQRKQDSIQQIQRDELEAKKKQTEELIKALEKETNNN